MVNKDDQDKPATTQEISAALEQLTENEQQILEYTARLLVKNIKHKAFGFDEEELFNEAMTRTLDGRRQWFRAKVTLCKHLHGVMKSITSHWWESNNKANITLESQLHRETESPGRNNNLMDIRDNTRDPETKVIEEDCVAKINQIAKSRELAPIIIDGMMEGMTGQEIRELGITPTQYETEMKWIRRNLRIDFTE